MKRDFFSHVAVTTPCAVIGVLLATLTSHAFGQAPPICNALANVNNQLYLVAADGSLSAQLPTDTQSKSSISLAPDGSKVAYISAANPDAFAVADTAGRVAVFPVQKSLQGPFVGVSWASADVIDIMSAPTMMCFAFLKSRLIFRPHCAQFAIPSLAWTVRCNPGTIDESLAYLRINLWSAKRFYWIRTRWPPVM